MSDLSLEEFQSEFLGGRPDEDSDDERRSLKAAPHFEYTGSATYMDWTGILTTPIKDQGQCASCW